MTLEERIDQIHELMVLHDRMNTIRGRINECHDSYFRKGEKENLFISGETGLGKTTICKNYAARFPQGKDKDGAIIPVLCTSMPSSPTPKGLTTHMLKDMKCPAWYMGVLVKQKIRLVELVKDCKVQLVIMDELQHVIDPDSEDVLNKVSNLLKELINMVEVPIVMVGLPESVAVLTSNRQLGRRVSQREELTEFIWKDDEQRKQFRSLLKTIDEKLPLNKSSRLASPDIAQRIHYASDGVIAHFMKLIRHSADKAVRSDMDCIDLPLLSAMYNKHVSKLFPKKFNPFAEQNLDRQLRLSRRKAKSTEPKSVSNRIRPRVKKEGTGSMLKAS